MGDAASRQTAGQLILNNRMSKSLRRYGRSGRSDWPQHQGGGGPQAQRRYRRPHLGTKQDSLPQSMVPGMSLCWLWGSRLCGVEIFQLIDFSARSVRALKVSFWPTVAEALRPTVGYWHVAPITCGLGRGKKNENNSTGGLESHNPDPNIHSDLATDSL